MGHSREAEDQLEGCHYFILINLNLDSHAGLVATILDTQLQVSVRFWLSSCDPIRSVWLGDALSAVKRAD